MGLLGRWSIGNDAVPEKQKGAAEIKPNAWDKQAVLNRRHCYFHIDFKQKAFVVDVGGASNTLYLQQGQPASIMEDIRNTLEEILRRQRFIDARMISGLMIALDARDLVTLQIELRRFAGQIEARMPKTKAPEEIDPYKEAAARSEESGKRAEERRFEVRQAVHRKFFEPR